jgi:hypothetical protein
MNYVTTFKNYIIAGAHIVIIIIIRARAGAGAHYYFSYSYHNNYLELDLALGLINTLARAHITIIIIRARVGIIIILARAHIIIGPQGTSICSRGPRVSRIPYKSGQFFGTFCLL